MKIKCSIVIPVLESYAVVNRQLKLFNKILPGDWELIMMDDGSEPAIISQLDNQSVEILKLDNFQLIETHDTRPWSQPAASNKAAKLAKGKYLFHTDIDHIITSEAIESVNNNFGKFHKMVFRRTWGVLDKKGTIIKDKTTLINKHGLKEELFGRIGSHANTFAMLREDFIGLGGYDEKFCGAYGGDDNDFNDRYGLLARPNGWQTLNGGMIYVYPDPRNDFLNFHKLRWYKIMTGSYAGYKGNKGNMGNRGNKGNMGNKVIR